MLADVVHAVVAHHDDLELVGGGEVAGRLRDAGRWSPDVVVASLTEVSQDDVLDFLAANGRVRVLALQPHADSATLYEMRPHTVRLGALGVDTLARVLADCGGRR